ncbi:class I SAM-dependent methyltransferase [Mycobacterium riyadhense]|uniref:class I SAM-dependent methyltransferase n=1 Tax=Mycobacterium riyadhense TaxID=486698 RepID=UPI001957507D|nr:class I SAM-dependent methyltransferase [Mycobacterium riyadhense]
MSIETANRPGLTPVSRTAFYCCGMRAVDARSARSICADIYADDLLTDEGRAIFAMFHGSARQNVSTVVRSRIFQDEIAAHLKADPDLQIVNIGAGFDSRAFRIAGGRWFEIDEPAIIEHKNARLPERDCPNPLQRIAVEFDNDELVTALRVCDPGANTLIVMEGVSMYLKRVQVIELLQALREALPTHTLICDLMNRTFFEKHMGKAYEAITALGSEFKLREPQPEYLFLGNGYQHNGDPISIVGRARDFGVLWVPGLLFRTILKSVRDGYCVHSFRTAL